MRLIDADAFIKHLEEKINGSRFYTEFHSPEEENVNYEFLRRLLDNFPGYVTDEKDECVKAIRSGDGSYRCSSCKGTVSFGNEYCPNCGEKLNWLHTLSGGGLTMNEVPEWFLKMSAEEQCKFIEKAGREARIGLAASLNNGWISVEDMLPEPERMVLVFWQDAMANGVNVNLFGDNGHWMWGDGLITHWQPLPEPPKEAGVEATKETD